MCSKDCKKTVTHFVFLISDMNSAQYSTLEIITNYMRGWSSIFCYFGSRMVVESRTLSYVPIGCVPLEWPPFSALNIRSRAYHFHKWPKNPLRSITILQGFFSSPSSCSVAARGRLPDRTQSVLAAPQGYSRPESQPDASYKSAPETRISHSSPLQSPAFLRLSHSGAPHFSLCRGTYLPKSGASAAPPPPN